MKQNLFCVILLLAVILIIQGCSEKVIGYTCGNKPCSGWGYSCVHDKCIENECDPDKTCPEGQGCIKGTCATAITPRRECKNDNDCGSNGVCSEAVGACYKMTGDKGEESENSGGDEENNQNENDNIIDCNNGNSNHESCEYKVKCGEKKDNSLQCVVTGKSIDLSRHLSFNKNNIEDEDTVGKYEFPKDTKVAIVPTLATFSFDSKAAVTVTIQNNKYKVGSKGNEHSIIKLEPKEAYDLEKEKTMTVYALSYAKIFVPEDGEYSFLDVSETEKISGKEVATTKIKSSRGIYAKKGATITYDKGKLTIDAKEIKFLAFNSAGKKIDSVKVGLNTDSKINLNPDGSVSIEGDFNIINAGNKEIKITKGARLSDSGVKLNSGSSAKLPGGVAITAQEPVLLSNGLDISPSRGLTYTPTDDGFKIEGDGEATVRLESGSSSNPSDYDLAFSLYGEIMSMYGCDPDAEISIPCRGYGSLGQIFANLKTDKEQDMFFDILDGGDFNYGKAGIYMPRNSANEEASIKMSGIGSIKTNRITINYKDLPSDIKSLRQNQITERDLITLAEGLAKKYDVPIPSGRIGISMIINEIKKSNPNILGEIKKLLTDKKGSISVNIPVKYNGLIAGNSEGINIE